MMTNRRNFQVLLLLIISLAIFLMYCVQDNFVDLNVNDIIISSSSADLYAVFGCSTPGEKNHRGYDYAFYLPLTALAWERFGFKSVVQIIGTRIEWERSRPLSWILSHLEARRVTILFIDAMNDNRPALGQIARIFTVNFAIFPGRPDDFLIVSDADLWPMHRDHFVPLPGKKIHLVHGECCGPFPYNGSFYKMYPMSNIGATVQTWRQIMNDGYRPANDSESMLDYLQLHFGDEVRRKTAYAKSAWYMDQRIISIRIKHWMNKYGSDQVHVVPDKGFDRIDRPRWKNDVNRSLASRDVFQHMYDAHLPPSPYMPNMWKAIEPLLGLMFGNDSWQISWTNDYAKGFYLAMNESLLL